MRLLATLTVVVVAVLGLAGPASALQTEVKIQGITLEEEREIAAAAKAWQARVERLKPDPEPESVSTPPSAPTSGGTGSGYLSASQVASYLRAAGFPESTIATMVSIAAHESGFCPTAVNGYLCAGIGHAYPGGPACGLLQIFPCPGAQALNPATNVAYAYQKYVDAGYSLSPWGH